MDDQRRYPYLMNICVHWDSTSFVKPLATQIDAKNKCAFLGCYFDDLFWSVPTLHPQLLVSPKMSAFIDMEVSWNGGTPSHHPFLDGIFSKKTTPIWGYPHDYGNPHIFLSFIAIYSYFQIGCSMDFHVCSLRVWHPQIGKQPLGSRAPRGLSVASPPEPGPQGPRAPGPQGRAVLEGPNVVIHFERISQTVIDLKLALAL